MMGGGGGSLRKRVLTVDGVEVWRIGRQEEEVTARGFDQFQGGRRVMKAGVVQYDHAARRQDAQPDHFQIELNDLFLSLP